MRYPKGAEDSGGLQAWLPMEPLSIILHDRAGAEGWPKLGARVGTDPRLLWRMAKKSKVINWATADRVCVALGIHPIEVWPFEWVAASSCGRVA